MSLRTLLIVSFMMTGLLSGCGDTKSKEAKMDAEAEKAKTEMNVKALEAEAEILAAKKKLRDSLRKVDSLEQVKSHGHAH